MTLFSCPPLAIVPMLVLGTALQVTIVPPVVAQSSPTSTFENQNSVDFFDDSSSRKFDPMDLIHQATFSRQDPLLFFEQQQENLNSEVLDFRTRQLEKLREQGYKTPIVVVPEPELESSEISAEKDSILLDLTPEPGTNVQTFEQP